MAYQTVTRIYSVELIDGEIKDKKERWLNSNSDYDYEEYYTALTNYLDTVEEDSMLDAV